MFSHNNINKRITKNVHHQILFCQHIRAASGLLLFTNTYTSFGREYICEYTFKILPRIVFQPMKHNHSASFRIAQTQLRIQKKNGWQQPMPRHCVIWLAYCRWFWHFKYCCSSSGRIGLLALRRITIKYRWIPLNFEYGAMHRWE